MDDAPEIARQASGTRGRAQPTSTDEDGPIADEERASRASAR